MALTDRPAEAGSAGEQGRLIRTLHRASEGVVSFAAKSAEKGFQNLFSIPVTEVESTIPSVQDWLQQDSYFTLNSMTPKRGKSKLVEGLLPWVRSGRDVAYLNAVWVDLDCEKKGIDPEKALAEVLAMERRGEIPACSIVTLSGRGCWLLWLLVDDTGSPPRADLESVRLFRQVEAALIARFTFLGADGACKDASRLTRVPGSLHTGAGKRVRYLLPDGEDFTYTLAELADRFGVDTSRRTIIHAGREPTNTGTNNYLRVPRAQLADVKALEALRGGFSKDCRNNAVFVTGALMRRLGYDPESIAAELTSLSERCIPPLSINETNSTIQSVLKQGRRFSHQFVSRSLEITEDESEYLAYLPPAEGVRRRWTKKDDMSDRETSIRMILEEQKGVMPSLRRWEALLGDHGHKIKRTQIAKVLEEMGLR